MIHNNEKKNSFERWHRKQEGYLHIWSHKRKKENGSETRSSIEAICPSEVSERETPNSITLLNHVQ